MVPARLTNYFLGNLGASAALIGLLFVAVSIAPEHTFGAKAITERRAIAVSAFLAFLNAFYISLVALIPTANIGYVVLVMALVSLVQTANLVRHIWEGWRRNGVNDFRQLTLLATSFVLYALELPVAVALLNTPTHTDYVYDVAYLLIAAYGVGVGHSWRLLGASDEGLFTLLGLRRDPNSSAERTTRRPRAHRPRVMVRSEQRRLRQSRQARREPSGPV